MSFTMSGFQPDIARYARFYGTKGELIVNMDANEPAKSSIQIQDLPRIFRRRV